MMDRRRALMMEQGETLIDAFDIPDHSAIALSPASTVYYIKIGNLGTDPNRLPAFIRLYCFATRRKMWDDSSHLVDYEGSIVDTYLTTTLFNGMPQNVQNNLADYSLSVNYYTGSGTGTKTLQRKIFLSRGTDGWIGDSGIVTKALKAYLNITSANTARICKTSATGSAQKWWLADKFSTLSTKFAAISTTGALNSAEVTQPNYVRPIITLKQNAKFKLVNGIYYLI